MKKFLRFFISKQFLLNIAAIVLVWVLIIWIQSMYLDSFTNHDEEIAVPSFYQIHQDDLAEFTSGKDIKYTIVDSVFMDDWPKGTVCWQYPQPTDSTGMNVKPGREIQLSVVRTLPQMIAMPKVVDMSQRMAETTLQSLGLRTTVSYQPAVEGKGFVLKQLYNGQPIPVGQPIPKGTRIELVVAKGKTGEVTALPDLKGLTINEAKQRLLNLTLSLHVECETCETEEDEGNAIIINQSPNGGANANVSAGTTVTVWATKSGGTQ